jgi:ElaB/YqjD/DUF883 family membrane-anchored ribosome-binding protein
MESSYDTTRSAFSERRAEGERAVERMGQNAHAAVDRATQVADRAMTSASAAVGQLGRQGEVWMDTTRGYVREHPFVAIGIAAAAGFALSLLARGR